MLLSSMTGSCRRSLRAAFISAGVARELKPRTHDATVIEVDWEGECIWMSQPIWET